MCILNNYLVCYSDAFGREVYEEVIASNIEEATENIQEGNGEDNMKSTTETARRCLFNMVSAMHNELGCKGALDSDFSHCKSCVMFYAVNEWDGESTGCRVQDMEKSLDWIDGGVY